MAYPPSAEQQAVIDSEAPVVVVIGGAGTGKTTTAAAAAGQRLAEIDKTRAATRIATPPGLPTGLPSRKGVLFVSFSRTASARSSTGRVPSLAQCASGSTS